MEIFRIYLYTWENIIFIEIFWLAHLEKNQKKNNVYKLSLESKVCVNVVGVYSNNNKISKDFLLNA